MENTQITLVKKAPKPCAPRISGYTILENYELWVNTTLYETFEEGGVKARYYYGKPFDDFVREEANRLACALGVEVVNAKVKLSH